MEFVIKTPLGDPAAVAEILPEVIAGQRVGWRLAFKARHDITVEFAGGTCGVDDVDLIIYIVPDEFFCYRDGEYVLKFILNCRQLLVDHRPPLGKANARATLSALP